MSRQDEVNVTEMTASRRNARTRAFLRSRRSAVLHRRDIGAQIRCGRMGQALSVAVVAGLALGAALVVWHQHPVKHAPGYIDEDIVGGISRVQGEAGTKHYFEKAKRDKQAYPVPAYLKKWHETCQINLAVTGESGTGKSTLVNALMGNCVAETGASETTGIPTKPFALPVRDKNSSEEDVGAIYLWDLPGQGTMKFPSSEYIKRLGLRYFDVVVLVVHNRVKECNVELVKDLQKHNVPVLVVVNKIDDIVKSAKFDMRERGMEPPSDRETFRFIRKCYTTDFIRDGCDRDAFKMFLLSSQSIREGRASGIGTSPLNREWEPFQRALIEHVSKARGVPIQSEAH